MNAAAKQKLLQIYTAMARTYGVKTVAKEFSIEPTMVQKLQDKIVEQSTFLPKINVIGVDEMKGQVILGGVTGPVSGRTNTDVDGNERKPRNVLSLEPMDYELFQTNSDVYIKFATIDGWAKFPDFAARYSANVQKRIANDRELIGWYGESAEDDTDIDANPLLQDVNVGWMQLMRDKLPANVLAEGETAGELHIGPGGDYETLDQAVSDLLSSIPEYLRAGVIAMVGTDLVAQESATLFKKYTQPSEKLEIAKALSTFGGLDWETPSNFPSRGLVLTSHDNLSIYHQDSSWRRYIKEKPEKNRIEDYNSRNEGYAIEELRKLVAVEFKNVKVRGADDAEGNATWI